MLKKRIIPCLDVRDGRTVKGVRFVDLMDMGDPAELAGRYAREGADELVFLDISATDEIRTTARDWVRQVAAQVDIPFTVGGGITAVDDAHALLQCGADKITVNSAAVRDPGLIDRLAAQFGSQCVVLAVDVRLENGEWMVYISGGKKPAHRDAFSWIREAVDRGAGELLVTSMDHDGTRNGFATGLYRQISSIVDVPVIASGGAGSPEDFVRLFRTTEVDAALAAGIFHEGSVRIGELKNVLIENAIAIRS